MRINPSILALSVVFLIPHVGVASQLKASLSKSDLFKAAWQAKEESQKYQKESATTAFSMSSDHIHLHKTLREKLSSSAQVHRRLKKAWQRQPRDTIAVQMANNHAADEQKDQSAADMHAVLMKVLSRIKSVIPSDIPNDIKEALLKSGKANAAQAISNAETNAGVAQYEDQKNLDFLHSAAKASLLKVINKHRKSKNINLEALSSLADEHGKASKAASRKATHKSRI